jgi:5-methyltetrahydropteroyltriglutamate--homocysteine methyltransferase
MSTVHHADIVGSLVRPAHLVRAREQHLAGNLAAAQYKQIEDRAVDAAVGMQESLGLDVVNDGELRRNSFIDQLTEAVEGLSPDTGDSAHIPVPFRDETGEAKENFAIPLSVTGKLRRRRMMTPEEFTYLRAVARKQVKITLPSPLMLFLVWSPTLSRQAYQDPFEMFADGLELMREEAQELAHLGCDYIQIDAPDFGQLVDPRQCEVWEAAGIPIERVFTEGVDMLNSLADVPGVTFALHLCRGNYDSEWISEGSYDSLAKRLFRRASNYDVFVLEYDDERSGSFEALRELPDDKIAVLGLVSSKFGTVEPQEQLLSRIGEAAKFFPREQLAISTQCGFASAGPGNAITEAEQTAKLRLVADVADAAWG